ncbi:hypothetical protein Tco_0979742, partial [Tanacetum coccineum]
MNRARKKQGPPSQDPSRRVPQVIQEDTSPRDEGTHPILKVRYFTLTRRIEAEELPLDAAELSKEDINSTYRIMHRKEAKEPSLDAAELNNHCMCFQVIISPGINFSKVIHEANEPDGDLALTNTEGSFPKAVQPR